MSDLQHAASDGETADNWAAATVAADLTHHLLHGQPLYDRRFDAVQKFHAPGLAPVRNGSEAYHIRPNGESAYQPRFIQTWGFYEGRASVEAVDGWMPILPDGSALSRSRFDWCGNFQEGRCAVRFSGGSYGHLAMDGGLAYEERHLYAGDFRDGIAAVRHVDDGLCGHIDGSGEAVHVYRYLDMDVFHKGYARARDERGWFHVRRDGTPAYERRFAAVEPFYNGQALCETYSGNKIVVAPNGLTIVTIR